MKFSFACLGLFAMATTGTAKNLRRSAQENCVEVTLTGTGGGPVFFGGLAGAGTLVTYGPKADGCRGTNLQFDMGRGTTLQLSKLGLNPTLPPVFDPKNALDAILFTHVHNDHTDDLAVYMSACFQFAGNGGPPNNLPLNQKVDVVCSEPFTSTVNGQEVTTDCAAMVANIGAAMLASGEVAQRVAEGPIPRNPGGPSALANTITFPNTSQVQQVWSNTDNSVVVEAISTNHIGGHVSYRVTTPVGTVVIAGDASENEGDTRGVSTSLEVEQLASGADILVHSAIHPVFAPDAGSGYPPPFYARQSNVPDIGSMADRAGVGALMLTHLIPSLDAQVFGAWTVPGGPLDEEAWEVEVESAGYNGPLVVGGDLSSVRLPAESSSD